MSVEILNNSTNVDLQFAGDPTDPNTTVIWPLPRSFKIDFATILDQTLQGYGFEDDRAIPVITAGSFHPSMMRDPDFVGRPVIVVQRASDQANRQNIGQLTDIFTFTDVQSGRVLDPSDVLANIGTSNVIMEDQVSDEIIDVWLFDENAERVEQLYLLVKTIGFAATKTFMEVLGYTEFIRVNGSDGASLNQAGEGGAFIVEQRNLQFRGRHIDFLAGIEQVVDLISESFTANAPPEQITQTVDLS